ncbi:MAG: PepSY domain-containing protein, partial [Oxalobacteraceae bacterium]
LWWRSGRSARSRMKFDFKGSGQRKLYDTHRLLGLGSLLFLLISVGTATAMSLPKQVRPILQMFSPIVRSPELVSGVAEGRSRIPVDEAMAIAQQRLPQGELRWVKVPNKPDGVYAVRFWQPGEPSNRFPKSYVWVDQYDGQVLAIRNGPQDSASDQILTWLYPLHSGEAFGLLGRSLVALLGLVPAILFFSGLLRWRSKTARLRANRQSSKTK